MGEVDKKSVDRATQIMIEKAAADGCETTTDIHDPWIVIKNKRQRV